MKHYNWCLRSYILVMLLRDVQLTVGRESAMLQMPWMVLFEFLGCNKNILHSYSTFLQKTSWVLNKLVNFITALKVETKKQVDETGLTEESGILVKNYGITNYCSSAEL